jgi:TolB-like protein
MNRNSKDVLGSPDAGFSFGRFRLEADGTLWLDEAIVHLTPKELSALRVLAANAGRIVSPLQLKHALWGDVHVSADSLPKCLSSLRAKLRPEDCIQTVYKRGYRFSTALLPRDADPSALPRLAILPFATGYAVPEHLGSALAEEAIVRLVNLERPAAAILARDSVFSLAQQLKTAQQVGETLKADLVLTGALSALAAHYRLRAEMIRIEDGTQIWVEDLLIPHSQIAHLEVVLVQRLLLRLNLGGLTLAAAAAPAMERHHSQKQHEAWDIYLRGHHEWQTLERHRMADALLQLQQAAALDPALVPARVDIVNLCTAQAMCGFLHPAVAAREVRRIAEPSAENPPPPDATLPALGWVRFHVDRDLPGAVRAFEQAEHLPHDLWTTQLRFLLAISRHRFPEAIGLLRAALHLDPFSPWLHARLAWALHLAGEAGESVAQIERTIGLFPHHDGSIFYGGMILSFNGEAARALELADPLKHRIKHFDLATATHAYALACTGRRDEARSILERMQWLSRERFVISSFMPAVHAALGDVDAAVAALRVAGDARCPWYYQMLADPRLARLHGHPEFEEMRAILPRMEASLEAENETEVAALC